MRSPQRIILGITVKSQGGLHPSVTQGTFNNVASGPPQYSWTQDLSTVTSSSPTLDSPVSTDNQPGHVSSLFPPPTLLTWTLPFLLISCLLRSFSVESSFYYYQENPEGSCFLRKGGGFSPTFWMLEAQPTVQVAARRSLAA